VFDKLEADLARGLMSLPASKGFEIGSGFAGTRLTGIQHNDPFTTDTTGRVRTASNRSGGVQGGISNGEDIVFRVAFKPTATISQAQQTVDRSGQAVTLEAHGRHDPCVLPRANGRGDGVPGPRRSPAPAARPVRVTTGLANRNESETREAQHNAIEDCLFSYALRFTLYALRHRRAGPSPRVVEAHIEGALVAVGAARRRTAPQGVRQRRHAD
jgi:hypothetical protein